MQKYDYEALSKIGRKTMGSIEAKSEAEAQALLRVMGNTRIKIKGARVGAAKKQSALGEWRQKYFPPGVKEDELAVFTKQLSVMVDAGVSVVQALDILSKQSENPTLSTELSAVRGRVETGFELGEAMAKSPRVFDNLYVALIKAGTSSGQLDVMLKRLSIYIEKAAKLKRQLKSALSYPAIIIVIAAVMTTVMLVFVVPMFAKNYEESGKPLPEITQLVVDMSNGLQKYWYIILGSLFGTFQLIKRWRKTEKGARKWDTYMLKMPIFGNLVSKVSIARFSSTMATLIASGIAIIEALEVCSRAAGNYVIETEIMRIREDVARGKGLAQPMGNSEVFPQMVGSMVAIGEQSGQLDQMLEKVAAFYEDEVDQAMGAALKMIEPMMFVIIGGIVGFILLAMYMPVFDMASNMT